MDLDTKAIGERIKLRRAELNLKQTDVKAYVGISSGNLSDIENGNRTPAMKTLIKLSDVLQCSIDWIVKGESPEKESSFFSQLGDSEKEFISIYKELSLDDQTELLAIAKIKYDKLKRTNVIQKSSNSPP